MSRVSLIALAVSFLLTNVGTVPIPAMAAEEEKGAQTQPGAEPEKKEAKEEKRKEEKKEKKEKKEAKTESKKEQAKPSGEGK